MASKTLAELDADCGRWKSVSATLMALGQRTLDTARMCSGLGWHDEAEALTLVAAGIGRLVSEKVLPLVEAHGEEHFQAACEVARLEKRLGEAS
jgi:hypothetical protein